MRTGSSWQVVGYECQSGLVGLDMRDPRCKFNPMHAYIEWWQSTYKTVRSSIQQGFGVDCYVYRASGYYAELP